MSAPRMADRSQNADFVPPWMADLGLVAGPNGWLSSSKAQLRTMQRPDQTLNVRVWATGMLHAPGYNGQEAMIVRSKNGPKEPLRPSDIVRELFVEAKKYYVSAGIKATDAEWERLKEPREAIREAMSQLEEYGVAQRTDGKGTPFEKLSIKERQRLPSGRTRMFFWLFPRNANPVRVRQEWEQFQNRQQPVPPTISPDDASRADVGFSALPLPPIWQILKVFQIEKPEKSIINDPDYQQRVQRAIAAARPVFLEVVLQPLPLGDAKVGPQAPPEVGLPAGALESKVERHVVVQPMGAGSSSSTTTTPRSQSSVHLNGKTTAAAALLSAAPPPVSPSLASAPIESFVARELNLDDEAAQQLVAGCKDVEPSVTGPEIVELAREKQHTMKEQVRTGKITSPVGLLIKHVPKMCKGGTLQAVRERLEAVARDRATRIGYAREAWPELNAEERAEVLQKYPELAELRQGAGA